MKQRALKIAGGILGLIVVAAATERVAEWRGSRRFPRVGRLVSIGPRRLNIHCEGSGQPTIVYESGKQIPGFFWKPIASQTAEFARSCWYDRAGMGWSDPAPVPRTSIDIALDVRALLDSAGERPPFVVVAHSLGGFYARVFTGLFRKDVAGLVLIDPASEDIATRMPSTPRRKPPLSSAGMARVARALNFIGLPRVFAGALPPRPATWSDSDWRELNFLERQPKSMVANIAEGPYQALGDEARAAGPFGSTPVIVMSAGRDALPPDALKEKLVIHRELAAQSTQGRVMWLENSGHFIPLEYPDSVVAAVRSVMNAVRTQERP